MQLNVNGETYRVEFNHQTQKLAPDQIRRAFLHEKHPIKAITTCVVIHADFVGIDTVICQKNDPFEFRAGRLRALRNLLSHCGPLRRLKEDFWEAYLEKDPGAFDPVTFLTIPPPKQRKELSIGEIDAKKCAAGSKDKVAKLRAERKESRREARLKRILRQREGKAFLS